MVRSIFARAVKIIKQWQPLRSTSKRLVNILDLLAVVANLILTKSPSVGTVIIPSSQMRFSKASEVHCGNLG